MSDDERAIRKLIDTWMAATKAGDIDAVLGLVTDDVLFQVPGREPFGKAEFAEGSKGLKGVTFDGKSEILELRVLGEWAWMRCHIHVAVTPPGGIVIKRHGYTLTVLRKGADGQWRLARDANSMV